MEKTILLIFSIVMLTLLSTTIVPIHAFLIPPNPVIDDNRFEVFGPHVQGILITIYDSTTTEWNDMNLGKIDITDWALDSTHLSLWNVPNGAITAPNYGGDNDYFLLDLNNNATYAPSDSDPFVHNPTSELPLREAIAYAVNRSYITQFSEGFDLPIYTPVPLYMAGYVESTIYPGAGNQSLTWSNLNPSSVLGNCDIAAANAILNAAGYTIDGSGWRIDPVSQGGTGAELNLIFYSRAGDRGTIGDDIDYNLNTYLHIKTTYYGHVAWSTVTGPVFAQQYFNLYTGGWTGIGPDPDYVCDLYNSSNYYHPGSPENYDNVHYPQTDQWASATKLALSTTAGATAVKNFQYWFAYYAAAVPMYSTSGYKAFKNVPSETSTSMAPVTAPPDGDWMDVVNQKSFGANSWWSTLDMETYGNLYPPLNITYGFSSSITLQNIVYAQWFWDFEVLGRIYDGGWARDPYTLLYSPNTGVPQLFKNFTVGTWTDPVTHATKTSVIVTLRPDVYWQDGQPVTIADVYYSLIQISNDLLAKGFPPPWWYTTVEYMQSVEILDDYNIEVLLSVQSAWAAGWVAGALVLPMHIWQPIVAESISPSSNPVVQGTTPDPNIIGTGPYRWVSGIGTGVSGDITVYLIANTPGSVVHGITSPGYYLYYPVYADIGTPNNMAKINISPSATSTTVPFTLTLRNLWLGGSLDVTEWFLTGSTLATVSGPSATVQYTGSAALAPVSPYPLGTSNVQTVTLTLNAKTLTYVRLAVHIDGPATSSLNEYWNGTGPSNLYTYTVPNPWVSVWINVTMPIWVTVPLSGATQVVCSPSAAVVGSLVTCTATVSGVNATGTVTWSTSSSTGNFSSSLCTLYSGNCSTTYTDSCPGSVTIAACYSGDSNNAPSSGSSTLMVISNGSAYHSENFSSVQAAINAATPGSNVIVAPGTYNEYLTLNKTLTIIGESDSPEFGGGGSGIYLTVLSGASGSIVTGFEITSYDEGILVYAANCRIYGNSMSSMGEAGIVLEGDSATGNVVYDDSFQDTPTPINLTSSASGNSIYDNIISSQATVTLSIGANGNSIYQNAISGSSIVLNMTNSQANTLYYNDFLATVQVVTAGANTWDNGSGGNYWSDYQTRYPGATQNDSSGVWNTAYVINSNNKDNYPLMKPYALALGHDVAITSVVTTQTLIGQGVPDTVTVTAVNKGQYNETFLVTAYASGTVIGTQQVTNLSSANQITLTFTWDTTGFAGTYSISAYATPVPSETDIADNTFVGGTVQIISGGGAGRMPYCD